MGVKMKKTNLEFLSLLKSSLKNEKYDGEKIDFEDLVYIYKMSATSGCCSNRAI